MADVLPEDTLRLIFQWLLVPDLGCCHSVCQSWNRTLTESVEKGNAKTSVWRLKMEECRWHRIDIETGDSDTLVSYRDIFRHLILGEQDLVRNLTGGNYVDDCVKRPWLLSGHKSPIKFTCQIGDAYITIARDGEIKSWKFPITSNRPPGSLVQMIKTPSGELGKIESVRTIQNDVFVTTSGLGGNLTIVHLWENKVGAIQGRVIQHLPGLSKSISAITASRERVFVACADFSVRALLVQRDALNDALNDSKGGVYEGKEFSVLQVENSATVVVMHGHTRRVNTIRVGTNEGTLFSCCADQTVRLWNYTTGICERIFEFPGAVGGSHLIGSSKYVFVSLCQTLKESSVRIHSLNDGRQVRKLQYMKSRIQSAALFGNYLLCGAADGSLMEYSMLNYQETCVTKQQGLGSFIVSAGYLGGRQHVYALTLEGELILLKREKSTQDMDTWVISREIALHLRGATYVDYNEEYQTLCIPSSGYLVRVFVFQRANLL